MGRFERALKDQPGVEAVHVSGGDAGSPRRRRSRFRDAVAVEQPTAKSGGFSITLPIVKTDDDKRLVYGFASVIEEDGKPVVDSQGDIISEADLVKAAHGFMLDARNAGEMHADYGCDIGAVVESMVLTKDVQKAIGADLKKVGWFIGAKIADDGVWAKVKSGEYRAFSIGGIGRRVEA